MALPVIGAAARRARVVVSGLPPRHFSALRALPVSFRPACQRPAHTLRRRFQPGIHWTFAWLQAADEGAQPVRIAISVQGSRQAEAVLPRGSWALPSSWADVAIAGKATNHTFNWKIEDVQAKGFVAYVGGKRIAVVVAKEGPYNGRVVFAFQPDSWQLTEWGTE